MRRVPEVHARLVLGFHDHAEVGERRLDRGLHRALGAFAEVVPLTPGLNTIVVEAFNKGYRSSKASLSVVSGQFLPDTQAVPDALAVRLNASALDAIGTAAAEASATTSAKHRTTADHDGRGL
jgi:hypothetical protein